MYSVTKPLIWCEGGSDIVVIKTSIKLKWLVETNEEIEYRKQKDEEERKARAREVEFKFEREQMEMKQEFERQLEETKEKL